MPGGKPSKILRDIRPGLATVLRHLHGAVIGARVIHASHLGRLGQCHNGRPLRNAIVARDRGLTALETHRHDVVALLVLREIRTDRLPRIAAIVAAEHPIGRRQQNARIVWRQHQWRIPVEAIRLASRSVRHILRGGPNGLRFTSDLVAPSHVAILRLGVDDARIAKVRNGHESITTLNLEPVVVENAAIHARRAGSAPVVVVLHAATHVERRLHVERHVIEQPHGQVRNERPRATHVVRHRHAAVVADQHVVGVLWVNPDRVNIVVRHQRRVGFKRRPTVNGHVQSNAAHVNAIFVHWVDAHLTEVHRTRIGAAGLLPRGAAVGGAIHPGHASRCAGTAASTSASATSTAAASRRVRRALVGRWSAAAATSRSFNRRVQHAGVAPENVHRNAPQ